MCGTVKRYRDLLLIFLLKGVRPEKYRERYEVTGDQDRPLVPDPGRDVLPDHMLENLIAPGRALRDEPPTEEMIEKLTARAAAESAAHAEGD